MALVQGKSLATTCIARRKLIWEVPTKWTMEQASTVPYAYSIVYYALAVRGKLQRGESILIHDGSGDVGQAAISVALYYGAIVYTTVGSKEKREFLEKSFPQLMVARIGSSRDTSFEQFVMDATNGCGVDLVLNTLGDDKLQASMRCLSWNGRFLEIGEFNLNNNLPISVSKNISFHHISLNGVTNDVDGTIDTISHLISNGIENGAIRPLTTTVFETQQAGEAIRFMEFDNHIGKIVLKIRDEEEHQKTFKSTPKRFAAVPRTYMHSEKSYVIVGGLGGFGLELADWLVLRGATKLVLTSRSGIKTGYQSLMVRRWIERGDVEVLIDTNDVTTLDGARNLLTVANKLAPVGGIFNLAAVLHDALLKNQTETDFKMVSAPKVDATKHLDLVSRELCPMLDYFICFSSISCGRGNAGQSNYGLANSAMEHICEQRQMAGLPSTAIQWGPIGDTGMIIDNGFDGNDSVIGGLLPQRMVSCLKTMDLFMRQPHAVLASMVIANKYRAEGDGGNEVGLIECVAEILRLKDLKNIPDQATLTDLGMDSFMFLEIKETLEKRYDVVNFTGIHHLSFGTLKVLGELLSNRKRHTL